MAGLLSGLEKFGLHYLEEAGLYEQEKKEKEAKDAKEAAVIEAIVNDSDMEIPEAMLTTQQKQMVDEFAQRLQMQGLSLEQYFPVYRCNLR